MTPLRARLEEYSSRIAPGLGWRPLYITTLATLLMVVYHHQGSTQHAPRAFIEASEAFFGVEAELLHRHLWSHLCAVVILLLVPLAILWWGEGWTPRDLGLGIRGAHKELVAVVGLWLFMLPFVAYFSTTGSFQAMYPRVPEAATDVQVYLLHEGLYLVKWIAWEFFFRGFLLFGLGRDFLGRATLVSTIPFTLMHFGKPEPEVLGAVVAGLVLCHLALRSKSVWPGVLLHWMVASSMDFFAADWWR